jgi:large subunit ribosomal protein L22
MHVDKATQYLKDVIDLKRPVPFRRYKKQIAHKRGISRGIGVLGTTSGGGGRYPVKVAKAILDLIEEAKQNADYKGLDSDNMRILHIAAHRGRIIKGRMPRAYGRSTDWNEQTTTIELILELIE